MLTDALTSFPACSSGNGSQPDPRVHPGHGPLYPDLHRRGVGVLPEAVGNRSADRGRRADRRGWGRHGAHRTREAFMGQGCAP